jgi:MFS family permease
MTDDPRGRKALPFRPPFFYGWIIVGVSALTIFFSGPGQTYSVSTFIDSYITEFGWSRSTVSGMYSMGTLAAGLLMGLVGNFIDRRGHRAMTTAIALIFGLACLGMSLVNSPITLLAGFFTIRLLGQGSMSLSSSTLVPQWFIRKKGRALSLVALGGAAGSALLPPLNTWLIEHYGWRTGWRTWTILLWLIMAPAAYLLTRNRPEDVGLTPDDGTQTHSATEPDPSPPEDSWTVREAMGTRSFWLLLFCVMIPSAINTGLIFHQISIMDQVGIPAQSAAAVMSIMALIRLPVVLLAGQIIDRVPTRFVQVGSMAGLLITMVALYMTDSVQMAVVYGALTGITMAFQIIVSGVIWPDYYGRQHLGSIRGMTMMAGVIGSALGPLPYGYAYDIFGGYTEALTASMIFPILGMIAAYLAKPPMKQPPVTPSKYTQDNQQGQDEIIT